MRNTNKKGFTIVELVIVVAVIAILAAVLIPTFTGIIDRANLSADQKALYDMNTAIAMESATTLDAAIAALEKNGINASNLVPVSKGYSFIWNNETKKIELVKSEDKVNITDSYKELVTVVASADALVDAIKNDFKYIKLDADVTLGSAAINVEGKITIDLNGKKLDASASTRPFNMGEGADLTIDAEGSTIDCGLYGLANFDGVNATLTVNGGTFTGDLDNGAFIKIRKGGKGTTVNVVLNNVNYKDDSNDSFIVNDQKYEGTSNIVVNGGSYEAPFGFSAKNVTVDGATIKTEGYGVIVNGEAEVKNSTITTGASTDAITGGSMPAGCVAVQNGGSATVTNCTLSSANAALVTASSSGRIVANGNTITGEVYQNNANSKHANETKTVVYIEIDGKVEVDKTFE